jgi:hypothetical protein
MLIKIKSDDFKLTLPVPIGIIASTPVLKIVQKRLDLPLTNNQLRALRYELRRAKKTLGHLPLVEIHDKSNEGIYIKL